MRGRRAAGSSWASKCPGKGCDWTCSVLAWSFGERAGERVMGWHMLEQLHVLQELDGALKNSRDCELREF